MKKILTGVAMAALLFAACSKENPNNGGNNGGAESGVAYLSIKVDAQNPNHVRSSDENNGLAEESDIKTLYLLTFTDAGTIVKVPGKTTLYNEIVGTSTSPSAVKVSANSKQLVVIANPGTELKKVLDGLTTMSSVNDLKAAIANVKIDEITSAKGFTMITGGKDDTANKGDVIRLPFVDINGKIVVVTDTKDDNTAKTEAEQDINRLGVTLERLTSKMMVYAATTGPNVPTVVGGGKFKLDKWTVDAVNGTYFPFAEKTILDVAHTAGKYKKNFYTLDPNFADNTGIVYTTVDPITKQPVLLWTGTPGFYNWKTAGTVASAYDSNIAYTIENTMKKEEQKFKNATRIVMRATYFPAGYDEGKDWFRWGTDNYKSLAELKAAYAIPTNTHLIAACDDFYSQLKNFDTANSTNHITASNFAGLDETQLNKVQPGGEVVKKGKTAVIRWFQKGLCYYYYEIRHDNETQTIMDFGKYGVVRNNWYNLFVQTVSGPGTPWYPDINNPGEGDPDPNDPIDEAEGYLGIKVEVQPWIIWQTGMNI